MSEQLGTDAHPAPSGAAAEGLRSGRCASYSSC